MLHLAQVQIQQLSGKQGLQLLAQQHADKTWHLLPHRSDNAFIVASDIDSWHEGVLVLVEIDEARQPRNIQVATDWILEIVSQYLSIGITPDFLKGEVDKAEKWRQELTLKSQDLARRALEIEARRATVQTLEEDLKVQKQHLDDMLQALIAREKSLQERENDLTDR